MNRQSGPVISRRTMLKSGAAAGAMSLVPGVGGAVSARGRMQSATPVAGGTLTYGSGNLPQPVINPLNSISTNQNVLVEAMFLRLVYGRTWGDGVNPDLESNIIELGVAETMTEIEPDRVWEFTLRENVRWHDGQPVTADDVIFGIWLYLNKDAKATNVTPIYGLKGEDTLKENGGGSLTPPYDITVEGATKVGDNAVRIELEEPIPNYWVDWSVGYWPMPLHIFGEMPLEQIFLEPYATMPVGSGPFKAAKFVEGQYMELEANDDFYLGRPLLDRFIVRFGDADTLTAALEAQEIDGASVSSGPVYDRLVSLPYLVGNPVPATLPLGFATNFERWPDIAPTLNKAIMHAIDVPTLNEQLFSGTLRPSNYLFGHVVGLETPPDGYPTYEYDPEKAQALLSEVGWDASQKLEWIMWSPPSPSQDAMQAMLAAVGINAEYRVIDVATVVDELYREGNYDLVFADFGSAQSMEDNWDYIKCGYNFDEGGYNYARYCNEEVDALWQQALDTTDAADRKALWDQISLIFAEEPPQATLWRSSVTYVWNRRVQGAYPYQYQLPFRAPFERIWISQE
jgi:peptide/nickel transport system substrate-binding protein